MPNRGVHLFGDFRGGLNVESAPDHVADNELVVARNVDLSERGGMRKRAGTKKAFAEAPAYADSVTQLIQFPRRDGTVIQLAVVDKKLCRIGSDGTLTELQALTVDAVGYFVARNHLYFVDGSNFRYYNGTEVLVVNAPGAPQVSPFTFDFSSINPINNAGEVYEGLEEGVYRCAYRYVYGSWFDESRKVQVDGYSTVTITRPNNAILWQNIPAPPEELNPDPNSDTPSIRGVELWKSYPNGEEFRQGVLIRREAEEYIDYIMPGFSIRTIR